MSFGSEKHPGHIAEALRDVRAELPPDWRAEPGRTPAEQVRSWLHDTAAVAVAAETARGKRGRTGTER